MESRTAMPIYPMWSFILTAAVYSRVKPERFRARNSFAVDFVP
jgi:hypothetical protein